MFLSISVLKVAKYLQVKNEAQSYNISSLIGLFLKKHKAIDSHISQWSPPEKKQQFLNAYSMKSWQKTAQGKKNSAPRRMQVLSLNDTGRE